MASTKLWLDPEAAPNAPRRLALGVACAVACFGLIVLARMAWRLRNHVRNPVVQNDDTP